MAAAKLPVQDMLTWLQDTVHDKADLRSDSRSICAGDIFFAYPGDSTDGRRYITDAIVRGAGAVIYEANGYAWNEQQAVPHLSVADLKQWAGYVANAYYRSPDRDMYTVAVTGTNGKTSCAYWLGSALSRLPLTDIVADNPVVAVMGTLGIGVFRDGAAHKFDVTGYTTPDAVLLQRRLSELQADGVSILAFEASSIGLDQGRLNGLHIDTALLTNFTRDHLDYHGDMQTYEAAKLRLFDWPGLHHAVINLDDGMGQRLIPYLQKRGTDMIGYSLTDIDGGEIPVLRASGIRSHHTGTSFHLASPFGTAQVKTQLVGQFNVGNVLGVLGVLLARGVAWERAFAIIADLTPVPGRMQQFGGHDAPLIVIDYAHTPDALEKALGALRQVAQQRGGALWCVFGCGGDRDQGKRPEMGRMAEQADHMVLTNDNPRSEDPQSIITHIQSGISKMTPEVIEDRATAILWAVRHAEREDVILLAGKGEETYQEIAGRKLPFRDADNVALALAARATMAGGS